MLLLVPYLTARTSALPGCVIVVIIIINIGSSNSSSSSSIIMIVCFMIRLLIIVIITIIIMGFSGPGLYQSQGGRGTKNRRLVLFSRGMPQIKTGGKYFSAEVST